MNNYTAVNEAANKITKLLLIISGLLLLFFTVAALRELCLLLVVGFCLAYIFDPILNALEKVSISRPIGFFVISFFLIVIVSILFFSAIPTIYRELVQLKNNFPEILDRAYIVIDGWSEFMHNNFGLPKGLTSQLDYLVLKLKEHAPKIFSHVFPRVIDVLFQGYSITLSLFNLFLLPFIVYYFSLDFNKLKGKFLYLFPKSKSLYVTRLIDEIDTNIGSYFKGQLIVCTILFILYAIALKIIGIELWFTIAFIAGYGNLIPYIGFVSGIFLASIMALVTYGQFSFLLYTWLAFLVVQLLEGSLITPKIVGDSVGMSPLTVMLALVAGGSLFGLLGMCLAIPVAAAIKVLGRAYFETIYSEGYESQS